MKVKLCDVNPDAENKLPPKGEDKSGIGVHYIDAYIKPMNTKLEDGTAVRCKRRGLKITLSAGPKKGEGLMRRLDVSPDPIVMLSAALQEAAKVGRPRTRRGRWARSFWRSEYRRLTADLRTHKPASSKPGCPKWDFLRAADDLCNFLAACFVPATTWLPAAR